MFHVMFMCSLLFLWPLFEKIYAGLEEQPTSCCISVVYREKLWAENLAWKSQQEAKHYTLAGLQMTSNGIQI